MIESCCINATFRIRPNLGELTLFKLLLDFCFDHVLKVANCHAKNILKYNLKKFPCFKSGKIAQLVERLAFCLLSPLLCFTKIYASSNRIAGNTAHGTFWASVQYKTIIYFVIKVRSF